MSSSKPSLSNLASEGASINIKKAAWKVSPVRLYLLKAMKVIAIVLVALLILYLPISRLEDIEGWEGKTDIYGTLVTKPLMFALLTCFVLWPLAWVFVRITFKPGDKNYDLEALGEKQDKITDKKEGDARLMRRATWASSWLGSATRLPLMIYILIAMAGIGLIANAEYYWVYLYTGKTFRFWVSPMGNAFLYPMDPEVYRVGYQLFNFYIAGLALYFLLCIVAWYIGKRNLAEMLAWRDSLGFPLQYLIESLGSDPNRVSIYIYYQGKAKAKDKSGPNLPPENIVKNAATKFRREYKFSRSVEDGYVCDEIQLKYGFDLSNGVKNARKLNKKFRVLIDAIRQEYALASVKIEA